MVKPYHSEGDFEGGKQSDNNADYFFKKPCLTKTAMIEVKELGMRSVTIV